MPSALKKQLDAFVLLLTSKGARLARAGATRFHKQFSDEDFETMISEFSSEARTIEGSDEFVQFIRDYRKKLGRVLKERPVECYVTDCSPDCYVNFIYRTVFEGDSRGERFSWRVRDGRAELLGFDIFDAGQ
jgi:hypothetical protein